MRPAYYTQRRSQRMGRRTLVSRPDRSDYYIIHESSPYSLASMDTGLEGWASIRKSITKPFKQAAAIVKKAGGQVAREVIKPAAKFTFKAAKNVLAFQTNLYTLGLASKFTSVGKWSGTKTATQAGTIAGIGMAAIAGGYVAASALAPAATGTAGAAGASGGGWLSILGTGVKAAGIVSPLAAAYLKTTGAGVTPAPTQYLMGYGAVPGAAGGSGGFPFYIPTAGGGAGGGIPGQGEPGVVNDWLPVLLIGGLGAILLLQRR